MNPGSDSDVVSPELVLVDPELAVAARAQLSDSWDSRLSLPAPYSAPSPAAQLARHNQEVVHPRPFRSRRALVMVAATTVLTLVLLDVRVEVGRTPASAERVTPADEMPAQIDVGAPRATPRTGAVIGVTSRRFAWAPTPGADGYHVELFSGDVRIFSANSTRPALAIPARWTHDGKKRSLVPGEYRWYVWPVVDGRLAPSAIVQATLAVP